MTFMRLSWSSNLAIQAFELRRKYTKLARWASHEGGQDIQFTTQDMYKTQATNFKPLLASMR